MSDANDLTSILQRLESLEIKASFTEDLLDQLNMTIYQQQQLIDRLTHEVIQLRQQAPEGGSNGPRKRRDELPPHYGADLIRSRGLRPDGPPGSLGQLGAVGGGRGQAALDRIARQPGPAIALHRPHHQ